MPSRKLGPAVAASIFLLTPAVASADYAHVVTPGETLTSVAATDGLSVSALAAANGLSTNATLLTGQVLQIPPQSPATTAGGGTAGTAAVSSAAESTATAGSYVVQPGDTLTSIAQRFGTTVAQLAAANGLNPNGILVSGRTLSVQGAASAGAGAESSSTSTSGSYVVQPGDTLTAIAERSGTTVAQLAAANGLNPNGILVSGSTLTVPQGGAATGTTQYVSGTPAATGGPYPTPETVSGSEIADIASANGVPASLAQAIGWQESGWNNDEVSPVGAVGVMQIVPGTWQWIQQNMAGNSLSPDSAADNVRGGVLLLHSLLSITGSESMAAAGYYQGLASIREHGLYSDTQQYVNSVMALQQRFGGG